jgi:DHA2 family methylenomycin A resistance protein-like MFS transporter
MKRIGSHLASQPALITRHRRHTAGGSPHLVLTIMCVGYFLVLLDVTIVNVALPQIATSLGASVSDLQWVVDAYALALASLMLVGGTIGDVHGHRRVAIGGLAVFGAASLCCGIAPGTGSLIAARAVQGLGAALLLPASLAIVSRTFSGRAAQARAIGLWAGIGSLALPAGPLVGGALISAFGWRAVFLVNVPIVIAASVAALASVGETPSDRTRGLDVRGVALGAAFLLATTFAFIAGGRSGAGSMATVAAAVTATIGLALFIRTEAVRGEDAALPLTVFRRRGVPIANGVAATMNLCTLGTLFVLSLYLQNVQQRTPMAAGLAVLPLFAPLALLPPLVGRLTSRIGFRLAIVTGLTVAAAGLAVLSTVETHSTYPRMLAALLLWGVGLGILTPAVVATAIAPVPGNRAGLASAINNTARQAGGAVGIAIAGAVAGAPSQTARFMHGFHAVAVGAAACYLGVAIVAAFRVPD